MTTGNRLDATGGTERGWLWRLNCPGCLAAVTLSIPDSGMRAMRRTIDLVAAEVERPVSMQQRGACGSCGMDTFLKFKAQNGKVACAIMPMEDPGAMVPMSPPEPDSTPGFGEEFHFSPN